MKELEKRLGKKLFCQEDIDYIFKQVNKNINLLFVQDFFLENKEKIYEIEKSVEDLKSSELNYLFREYEKLTEESIVYQNCLAYYIGLKKGLNMNKNK